MINFQLDTIAGWIKAVGGVKRSNPSILNPIETKTMGHPHPAENHSEA